MTIYAILPVLMVGLFTPVCVIMALFWSMFDRQGNGLHVIARIWARMILRVSFMKIEITGLENVTRTGTYIFAANHSSTLDIPLLLAYLPIQFRWLAKEELFRIPFFGRVMRLTGYIPVNRSNPRQSVKSLERAAARIRAGTSVVIFPEGTRTRDGAILPFKRGGFTLAARSGRPVVPLSISGAKRALEPKTLKLRPGRIKIVIGRPLPTQGLDRPGQEELMRRVRRIIIEHYDPDYGSLKRSACG